MPNVYQFKDFAGSSHRILISLIRRFKAKGLLLDLGAAGGELGEAVREQFDKTIGFEYDIDRLPALREHFDTATVADLEKLERLPRDAGAIVMADVLEHLRNPADTLRMVCDSLDGKGLLFLSVPNIANVTIRLGLLFGVFEYRDRGILDHTHLRFYTRRTILRQIESAGFEVLAVRGSSVPIRLIIGEYLPAFILLPAENILALVTQWWKSLLAYQIIIVARPRTR